MSTATAEQLRYSPEEIDRELARRKHLRFIQYCWQDTNKPFYLGYHTLGICDRLDQAFTDFRNGISSYIAIAVHHRSGKSEIVSGNLAPHFLGEFPGREVMNVTYAANLAQRWGRRARSLFTGEKFHELYPNVSLSPASQAANRWEVNYKGRATHGGFFASGLSSGITGTGAHMAILDDYLPGRRAAESPLQRQNAWLSVTNEFMTRLAPIHMVVILATWWHFDDVRGRIVNMTDPTHDDFDPMFPKFDFIDFPARAEDYLERQIDAEVPEEERRYYPGEYLFDHVFNEETEQWDPSPEDWFGKSWYEKQYATLQPYAAAGIMDCKPELKAGNILDTSKIVVHDTFEEIPKEIRKDLQWYRVWDYAHTAKQRTGGDPDYTGGTWLAFRKLDYNQDLKESNWELYIRDYTEFRLQATERDKRIRTITGQDGAATKVLVENSLDSKDGADYLKHQLMGLRPVIAVNCPGDKVTRIAPMEPIFSAGRVHVIKGAWVPNWRKKLRQFDGSGKTHDEPVDNLSCGYKHCCVSSGYQRLRDPYQ